MVKGRTEPDNVDWNEPPLQRWLGTITRPNTRYSYRKAFRCYAMFTSMTATQLIDEALEDARRDVRERKDIVLSRLIGFYKWLKEEYPVKSRGKGEHKVVRMGVSDKTASLYVNAVRSFYSTYDVVVRLKGRHALPRPRVQNKRITVDATQVKMLVDHARTPRDRAILLTMFQGGMDVSTLCSLTYGQVNKEEHPLKLDLYRPKTGVEYYTFLGRDAIEAIKAYVNDAQGRGITFTDNTPLFVKERNVNGNILLTTNLVQNMMREVAVKTDLVDEKNNGKAFNPLGPHALRESFGSIMINSGVPDTIVDFWLGHSIGEQAEAYKGVQFKSLRQMYLDRERLLSISQSPVDAEEIRKEVRREVEEGNRKLSQDVVELSRENRNLRNRLESIEKDIDDLRATVRKMLGTGG